VSASAGELPKTIECERCREIIGPEPISRAAANEIHGHHRPMHPNEVGRAHRARARAEYDAWEALSPYRRSS
jgi:hypothetical protein